MISSSCRISNLVTYGSLFFIVISNLQKVSCCVSRAKLKDEPQIFNISLLTKADNVTESLEVIELYRLIGAAVRRWGFFSIIDHGLERYHNDIFRQTEEFFTGDRTVLESLRRAQNNSRGYADDELTKQLKDAKQIFDFGHKTFPDLDDCASENIVMDGCNQFPDPIYYPNFRKLMEEYYSACAQLSLKVMRGLSYDLFHNSSLFDDYFFSSTSNGSLHTSFLCLNYYPLASSYHNEIISDNHLNSFADTHRKFGVSRHTDSGALTILDQGMVPALQMYSGSKEDNNDGEWLSVEPFPNSLVVNIGDMTQVWSNNVYRAPEHRVLRSESVSRISIPFFFNPKYEAVIQPIVSQLTDNVESDISTSTSPLYRPFEWGTFRHRRFLGDFSDHGKEIQIEDYLIRSDENHDDLSTSSSLSSMKSSDEL